MSQLAIHGGPSLRTRPFPEWPVWDEQERAGLMEVLESGVWGALPGTKAPELERQFAAMHGVGYGIAATNGSHTLSIALQAAGVLPGDEVIVPAFTFLATATAVLAIGAIPVFADIDPETYLLDPDAAEQAVTARTRAVIPVHLGGQMAPMDRIMALAERHGLRVVEDCAQAHLSRYAGRFCGQWGHLASFSFQASKNASGGEGGMILTDHPALAVSARSYQNCGRREGGGWYQHYDLGSNYRMTEWQAAVLLPQIGRLERLMAVRERNAAYLTELLGAIPGLRPLARDPQADGIDWHLFICRYDEEAWGAPRDRFLAALAAEGVPAAAGYIPLYRLPLFASAAVQRLHTAFLGQAAAYNDLHLEVTERASRECVWFAQNLLLGERADMEEIASAVQKLWEHRRSL